MSLIYKVEQINYMGYPEHEKYFVSQSDAEKHFEEKLEELKKSEDAVDPEEDDDAEDFLSDKNNKIKSVSVWMWHKTSYEYDEYDRYPTELVIREIELIGQV